MQDTKHTIVPSHEKHSSLPDDYHLPDFDVFWPPLIVQVDEWEDKAGSAQHAHKDDDSRQTHCHTKVTVLQAATT